MRLLAGRVKALRRAPRVLAAAAATAVVAAFIFTGLARQHIDTTVGSLLPSGDQTLRTWVAEERSFGGDPIVVLLHSGGYYQLLSGTPLMKEIALEGKLSRLSNVAVVYGPGTTLNEIGISIQNLMVDIAGKRAALMAAAEAAARAAGQSSAAQQAAGQAAVAGYDQRYLSLIEQGVRVGLPTVSNPVFGRMVFLQPNGQGRPAFRWLVPDATHEAILIRPAPGLSQAQTTALVRAVRATVRSAGLPTKSWLVTGSPVIAASMGQEVLTEMPLLAGAAVIVVLGCFIVSRRRVRLWHRVLPLGLGLLATVLTMATFGWFGVPLSVGLLAFLPIILGVGTDYPIYALGGTSPRLVVFAVAASAVSLAVLALSPMPYVRELGLALVTGLVLSALLGIAAARLLGDRSLRRMRPAAGPAPKPRRPARRAPWAAVGAGALAAGLLGWSFLGTLGINSDPEKLASGLPALSQAISAQSILGASGELDIYVRGGDVLTPQFLAWYTAAQTTLLLDHGDQLDPVVSPATLLGWLGPKPTSAQIDSALQVLPWYLTTATVRNDKTQAVMAFGVKLGRLDSEAKLVRAIRSELPPAPAGATVSVTGLPAVAAHGYRLLSSGRLAGNLGGLAAFGLAAAVLIRRRRDVLVGVVAAGLATGWGLLILEITGTAFTPLTISLGPLTSAVGGEFALMAMWRRRAGQDRPWSTSAMAAATSAAGFLTLGLSRLDVLRQFGLVLGGSVVLALLASWVVVSLADAIWPNRMVRDPASPVQRNVAPREAMAR